MKNENLDQDIFRILFYVLSTTHAENIQEATISIVSLISYLVLISSDAMKLSLSPYCSIIKPIYQVYAHDFVKEVSCKKSRIKN